MPGSGSVKVEGLSGHKKNDCLGQVKIIQACATRFVYIL